MSCANPKSAGWHDVQDKYNKIQDAFLRLRPQLAVGLLEPTDSLIEELTDVASLANSIAQWRSKGLKSTGGGHDAWKETIDALDRDGVELWNIVGILRFSPLTPTEKVAKAQAALRLAAFRLIDAGLEVSPPIETLAHTLHVASKTGVTIAISGQETQALEVLTRAAHLESLLSNLDANDTSQEKTKAAASVNYFSSRMEVAIICNKDPDQAFFMLQQITDGEPKRLAYMSRKDKEQLSAKVLDIAKGMLNSQQFDVVNPASECHLAETALKWLRKSLSLLDSAADEVSASGRALKRGILRSLARAYYMTSVNIPENLAAAKAAIDDIILCEESNSESKDELLQVRWMKLAIEKKREDSDGILQACFDIVDTLPLSEESVGDIIQEARGLAPHFGLCSGLLQRLLKKALNNGTDHIFVDKIFMSILFVCSRESDHSKALHEVKLACNGIMSSTFQLSKISCIGAQSLLWQTAEKYYSAKAWNQAAEWYHIGTHEAFQQTSSITGSKCLRKAALCYIESRELQKAYDITIHCPKDEAATSYLLFLLSTFSGKEDEALRTIDAMIRAADFDRKMLFLATQLAHENKMKALLLAVLKSLFETFQSDLAVNQESSLEGITIIRCIVRLVVEMLKDPLANVPSLVDGLLTYYSRAIHFATEVKMRGYIATIRKDLAWLWRSGYNTAMSGCSEWSGVELQIAALFELTEELMIISTEGVCGTDSEEVFLYRVFSIFSSIAARVFAVRQIESGEKSQLSRTVMSRISNFKKLIGSYSNDIRLKNITKQPLTLELSHLVTVFEVELLCQQQEWETIKFILCPHDNSERVALSTDTLETVADILWTTENCPSNVLQSCLETLLKSHLDSESCSLESFSRWMRVICTILLARGSKEGIQKSLEYAEVAAQLIKDSGSSPNEIDAYPSDEHLWLLITCYNTGIECFTSNLLSLAKRWLETAAILSHHRESGDLPTYISDVYRHLLERYSET